MKSQIRNEIRDKFWKICFNVRASFFAWEMLVSYGYYREAKALQ
jgi:hypothetical protein